MAFSFLRRWFNHSDKRAAESAFAPQDSVPGEADFVRGRKFASGEGVAQDYILAAQCYEQAAVQNHSLAQYNLAGLYGSGQGVRRDDVKSLKWLTRAANLGNPAAQYHLGVHQHLAFRRDRTISAAEGRIEALKWVRLSATQAFQGAEGACEFVTLGMAREEVVEASRRAAKFVVNKAEVI